MTAPGYRAPFRWLTITLFAAGGVYAWYTLTQYDRLNDLNQRQLSSAAAELKTSLDASMEIVRQFDDKWRKADKAAKAAPKTAPPTAARDMAAGGETAAAALGTATDTVRPRVCDFVRSQSYLELPECTAGASDVEWVPFTSAQWTAAPALGLEVRDGSRLLKTFRYRTDKLLHELAFPESFSLLLVATDKGDVLYQDAPVQHRWLRYLRWGEQTFRDTHAERSPALQIQNLQEIVGGEAAWKKLRAVSSRTGIDLGGTSHQLYLQPLVLDSLQPIALVVGGTVQRSSVVRGSLALGASLLGILVFLVLLGLLGFPFIKLACLNAHERFCLHDIKLVYLSASALLVLFTCASLALDGYSRWRMEADSGLVPLAEHLEETFVRELASIRDQLDSYDQLAKKSQQAKESAWPCTMPVQANWFQEPPTDGLSWPATVNLKTVAWSEPGGQQVWKSTTDPIPGKINVAHRVYFRAVREDNLFQIDGTGRRFFFTPDRSISDAKFYTFVSTPSVAAVPSCAGRPTRTTAPAVLVATAQLFSLETQPLPAAYGFVVINREGRVLYHSDGRLSLRENLFEELTDGGRVRAMTYAGSGGGLDTRYREKPHRFYLQPIRLARADTVPDGPGDHALARRNAGFYLAVFRDTSVEQALLAHVFVVGLSGPMALVLLLCGGCLLALSLAAKHRQRRWSAWLWPHRGLEHIYRRQTVAFVALLLVCAGINYATGSVTPFLVAPFAAAALGVGIYWQGARNAGPRARLADPKWQRMSVFLVLVCMIVVPSAALFRVAVSQEFAKLILTETDWMRVQADDRARAAAVNERAEQFPPERMDQLRVARAEYLSCMPAPFDAPSRPHPYADPRSTQRAAGIPAASTGIEVAAAPTPKPLRECVTNRPGASATLQPIGVVAAMIGLLHGVDEILPIENETLVRQHFHTVDETYSPDGTIVRRFRAAGISLFGFALALGLLDWWIRWNTNRVFFADLDATAPPAGSCDQLWARCTPDEQMVLIQIEKEHIANPRQREIVEALLRKGLLQLAPDIQPFSPEFAGLIRRKERKLQSRIQEWQDVTATRSWRRWRLVLGASVAVVGFFLIATQPGLQSSVVAVATGTAGVLTAGSKLRDAFTGWLERKRS